MEVLDLVNPRLQLAISEVEEEPLVEFRVMVSGEVRPDSDAIVHQQAPATFLLAGCTG